MHGFRCVLAVAMLVLPSACVSQLTAHSRVTVEVTDSFGHPLANAPVLVNDAAGRVAALLHTGADGKVIARVPKEGVISAHAASGLSFESVAIVAPPDGATATLTLNAADPPVAPPAARTLYDLVTSQLPTDTNFLMVYSCGKAARVNHSSGTPGPDSWRASNDRCWTNPTNSFLAIAYQNAQQPGDVTRPLAWGVAVDQATKPSGSVMIPLALAHSDSTAFDPPLAASITAIPEGATAASVELDPRLAAQSPPVYSLSQSSAPQMPGQFASFTMPATPAGAFSSYRVIEDVSFTGTKTESHISRQRDYTKLPTSSTFAANALALVAVAPVSAANATRPQVTWSASSGARGDYAKVQVRWMEGTAVHAFTAYLPPDAATTFGVPEMPAELRSFAPAPASAITNVAVDYLDEETATGYATSSLFHPVAARDGLGFVVSGGSNQTSP